MAKSPAESLEKISGAFVKIAFVHNSNLYFDVYFAARGWLAEQMAFLSFLKPQMMGIIIFHLAAELGPALGAAGSLLQEGALTSHEIIVALLVGNIVSTPMRAIRHQLPAYSGFYRPTMALWLIIINQGLRAISMIAVTVIYVALCA